MWALCLHLQNYILTSCFANTFLCILVFLSRNALYYFRHILLCLITLIAQLNRHVFYLALPLYAHCTEGADSLLWKLNLPLLYNEHRMYRRGRLSSLKTESASSVHCMLIVQKRKIPFSEKRVSQVKEFRAFYETVLKFNCHWTLCRWISSRSHTISLRSTATSLLLHLKAILATDR
jgi:hypothetical protein